VKAIILAGGEGTRLRPLTLTTPKPVVPVVDRPFLTHQLDLLRSVGITDVVFSVAYRPERVQAIFGDGTGVGSRITYAIEDTPLGTGGAVKNAEPHLDDVTVVFNGDVLTDVDLPAVVERHRSTGAAATIVLTPVANPSAYGLVEFDADFRIRRFLEKPKPEEITTDTINAGIYVLQTAALELMPPGVSYSIERGFFPALLARGDRVTAFVHRGYWIDIGTPDKYLQVHRDVLDGRFPVQLLGESDRGGWRDPSAYVDPGARLEPPFYIGPGCRVAAGATVGPRATLTRTVTVDAGARVSDSVAWTGSHIGENAAVDGALLAEHVHCAANSVVRPGAVLGQGAVLPPFSRTGA
jgi:NDP-sugar pyrophosphorylase family protein